MNRAKTLGLVIFLLSVITGVLMLNLYQPATVEARGPLNERLPDNAEFIVLGMGCFWGAEKRMASLPGVIDVMSGYAGGGFSKPDYQKVLSSEGLNGVRNHAEVVRVVFDPVTTSVGQVLMAFWEGHDPTQGNRQGNDVGSNYRSAIYYINDAQKRMALLTRDSYQQALTQAGKGRITTEIAALERFYPAEDYHQDYLRKNPRGYCGLGGTGVKFPSGLGVGEVAASPGPLDPAGLAHDRQLIVFEAEHCPFCAQFRQQILDHWRAQIPVATTRSPEPPAGWVLDQPLWATPTIVLFREGKEAARYTGYNGEEQRFWKWLGFHSLSPEQIDIAFRQGTEPPFSGPLLDNKASGSYVDPVTGVVLFRSDSKFNSGTGWPSFFQPLDGSLTYHEDHNHGMKRVEVRSASSGIHLGHVFDDGPPPSGKRYCINGKVLRFVPDGSGEK